MSLQCESDSYVGTFGDLGVLIPGVISSALWMSQLRPLDSLPPRLPGRRVDMEHAKVPQPTESGSTTRPGARQVGKRLGWLIPPFGFSQLYGSLISYVTYWLVVEWSS